MRRDGQMRGNDASDLWVYPSPTPDYLLLGELHPVLASLCYTLWVERGERRRRRHHPILNPLAITANEEGSKTTSL